MISFLTDPSKSFQFSLVFLSLQIIVLIGFAWLIAARLRKRAALRHFIWLSTLSACALLVPLHYLVPAWEFQFASSKIATSDLRAEVVSPIASSSIIENPEMVAVPRLSQYSNSLSNSELSLAGNEARSAKISHAEPLTPSTAPAVTESLDPVASGVQVVSSSWLQVFFWIYVVVALSLLARLGLACMRLKRIGCSSSSTSAIEPLAGNIAESIGLKWRLRLVVSSRATTPMTFGVLRPTVVLPEGFLDWSETTKNAVLAHELSHLKRRDAIWDLIANLIGILYWFHPAVHFARRRLRSSREFAADCAAMQMGIAPAVYANELLSVASDISNQRAKREWSMAIPMAGHQDLSNRIKQVLEFGPVKNNRPKLRFILRCVFATLLLILASFSVQFSIASAVQIPAENQQQKPDSENESTESTSMVKGKQVEDEAKWEPDPLFPDVLPDLEVTGNNFFERLSQSRLPKTMFKDDPEHQRIDILGTVTSVDGSPTSNAIVVIRNGSAMGSGPGRKINCLLARTRTDDDGKYKFTQVAVSQRYNRPQIIAVTESGEMGWQSIVQASEVTATKTIDVQLEATSDLGGQLVDDQQNPIVGAQVSLRLLKRMRDTGRSLEQVGFNDRVMAPQTTTDDNGNFEFNDFPTNAAYRFDFEHRDFPLTLHSLSQSDQVIESAKSWGTRKLDVVKSGSQLSMDQGVEITGKVISDGKPVVGALVSYMYSSRCFGASDDNGDFKFVVNSSWLDVERNDRHIGVTHNDFAATRINYSSEQLKSGKLEVILQRPATISGKVQSKSGAIPIKRARLSVSSSSGNGMHLGTNDNGEFSFKIPPGEITVELFHAKGRVQRSVNGEAAPMVKEFTVKPGEIKQLDPFDLEQLYTIEVYVVNEDGEPVSGATAKLLSPGEHANYSENSDEATTAMDGSVNLAPWNKPTVGTLVVAKFQQDGQTMIGESFVKDESDITNIELCPSAIARGKVTLNGKPLAKVPLSFRISVPKTPFPNLHPSRSVSRKLAIAYTDENGEYSVDVPQVDANGILAVPHVSVQPRLNSAIPNVEAGGIGNRMNRAGLVYSRDIEFIEGPGEVRGRVVDKEGNAMSGIGVYISRGRVGLRGDRNLRHRLFQPSKVYTDKNGQFVFKGIPEDISFEIRTSTRDELDYRTRYTQDSAIVETGQKDVLLKTKRVESDE